MTDTYKLLVLTDHRGHTAENALYKMVNELVKHPNCLRVDVATRGNSLNTDFFNQMEVPYISVKPVSDSIEFTEDGRDLLDPLISERMSSYDFVWLRLPPPLSKSFLEYIRKVFPHQIIVNAPKGIANTGSKAFLKNFEEWCPVMKLCYSEADIRSFSAHFPVVLKPLRGYGGSGIAKVENDVVEVKGKTYTLAEFAALHKEGELEYLGVEFLKNVDQGDKRIVVIDGQIMGASLRMPEKGSWLCNVSQGGTSGYTEVDERERAMVEAINPILKDMGIIMYGMDTLVNDKGERVLSEINTTSIGGLPQIAEQSGKDLLKQASELLWNYFISKL